MILFCYGSLQFAQVMRAVTGRDFAAEPAVLDGHARYRVRDAEYPGLVPEPSARTEGTLYRGLDAAAVVALDRFEGAFYERLTLDVVLRARDGEAAGRREPAQVYVVVPARRHELSRDPWDMTRFEREDLDAFVRRFRLS